ncbi:MAG: uL15 family ribosomal protein [Candidatus Nanoarchaeia archaeon]|nr:uL15 family ribosomal protein [Candidatus Nanoarchaeia archaeon]
MINRRKKHRKSYGKRTHFHGAAKKWRGAGNRGGRGMAGTGKRADQKKTAILKLYGNKYFGRYGFKTYNKPEIIFINLSDLQKLVDKTNKTTINLKEFGYNKILGKGNITKKITVEVEMASKKAIEKIEKKGGKVILPISEESGEDSEE